MTSIWENNASIQRFCELDGDLNTDTLIIGGGIAGLLCAYKLKAAGVDCILLEADRILGGVTGGTTAKLTLAHGLIYDRLIKSFGIESARLYLEAQKEALAEYDSLCQDIDCDYERKDSYVYSLTDRYKIDNELKALDRLGVIAEPSDAPELPFKVAGAYKMELQAQVHPLKLLYAVAKTLPIYENTKVREYLPHKVKTNRGNVSFEKLIVATHFPVFNKHGGYSLKLYQHRSYVLALGGAEHIDGMYVDEADTGLSFRQTGDVLLIGGGGHRTGKDGGAWQVLERFSNKYYEKAEIVARWATQDCMTLDGIPYVGQYSRNTPNVYVVTGFNKWGMTNAMASANILRDLIMGKSNPYEELFSPTRTMLRPQLFVNALESAKGLLTIKAPRCPHLGCALNYNRAEHSWDCPCHGSRFSDDGELLNGPATDDHPTIGK